MSKCPCCSGKDYKVCCEPVIQNNSATSALTLMRSRFTAYANCQAEYLLNTTHPKTRVESSLSEIESWAKENSWTKLEIINSEKGTTRDSQGTVEFKAHFTDVDGKKQVHHEKSTFLKENGHWFYLEGIANPQKSVVSNKISRNDPCPCGSGKKFKKCCG
jgi:SEC-C motif-containing protein